MNILNIKLKNKIGAFEISSDGRLIINQKNHSAIPGYDLHPIFDILQNLEDSKLSLKGKVKTIDFCRKYS